MTQEPTSRRFVRQDNFDLNLSEEEILSDELLGLVSQNIEIVDIGLRRPTLDDVFMELTGHKTQEEQS